MIATKEMPVTIGVFVRPGDLPAPMKGTLGRRNRCFEYDGVNNNHVRFLTDELLPFIAKEFGLNLSTDGNDRCISGGSSGGIAAFPRISVRDPQTGKIMTADGPPHGNPQSEAFWRPVLTKLRDLLAKRGLAEALLIGYCADRQPDESTVAVFHENPSRRWLAGHPASARRERHAAVPGRQGPDPLPGERVGRVGQLVFRRPPCLRLKHPVNPSLRTWLDRGLFDASPICQFRLACRQVLLAERHGLGQMVRPTSGPCRDRTAGVLRRLSADFPRPAKGIWAFTLVNCCIPAPTVRSLRPVTRCFVRTSRSARPASSWRSCYWHRPHACRLTWPKRRRGCWTSGRAGPEC